MSPICLSAERCGGEDTVTATQVEPRLQEGHIKGAVHLKVNTTCSILTQLLFFPPHSINTLSHIHYLSLG